MRGWCVARLQTLIPVANFEEKLNKDFESQKERAEKAAKNLVQAANRKNQIRDLKETKKRKRAKQKQRMKLNNCKQRSMPTKPDFKNCSFRRLKKSKFKPQLNAL